jgi:hypothetical protein
MFDRCPSWTAVVAADIPPDRTGPPSIPGSSPGAKYGPDSAKDGYGA